LLVNELDPGIDFPSALLQNHFAVFPSLSLSSMGIASLFWSLLFRRIEVTETNARVMGVIGVAEFLREFDCIGGAEGDRTPDLMTASHALSQLSYGPMC
jgi:hypothetical protein